MGFFQSLFGHRSSSHVEWVPDQIWLTHDAKINGIRKQLAEPRSPSVEAILLVAHFDDLLDQLERIEESFQGETPIKAVPASNLNDALASSLNMDSSAKLELIVAERHPLPTGDQLLVDFADKLPCGVRLSHHLSLDDTIVVHLLGDSVSRLVSMLGADEHEAITSSMVTKRLQMAQKKMAQRVKGNRQAHSAAQWLEINCLNRPHSRP